MYQNIGTGLDFSECDDLPEPDDVIGCNLVLSSQIYKSE